MEELPRKLQEICRVCLLDESETGKLKSLYSKLEDTKEISKIVMECAPIQIEKDDNLPSFICNNCLENLNVSYNFRKLCIESDNTLKQLINCNQLIKAEILNSTLQLNDNSFEIKDIHRDSIELRDNENDQETKSNNSFENEPIKTEKHVKIKKKKYKPCEKCGKLFSKRGLVYHLSKSVCLKKNDYRIDLLNNESKTEKVKRRKKKKKDVEQNEEDKPLLRDPITGRYNCRICGSSLKDKSILSKHMLIHSDIRHECNICGKKFIRLSGLQQHKSGVHEGLRKYSCEFCGKAFIYQADFRNHRRSHLNIRNYKCTLCDKSFVLNISLKNHMLTHTGERPYSCSTCGKSFNRPHILKRHVMTHTGVKPFACELCDKRFSERQGLKLHTLSAHTGIRPFECETCGKGFTTASNLKAHERFHSGVRPWACDLCERTWTTKQWLKQHKLNQHNIIS